MIAFITGKLARKSADYLIVDVSGIGYQVHVPLSTYCNIPDEGDVSLHIYTHLREDSLTLFGFLTEAEKNLFLMLIGVSGIGPRLALTILSSLSVDDVIQAIINSDDSRLCSIPGIGKKTAGRMILELKDRMKSISIHGSKTGDTGRGAMQDRYNDAISALVNLGYKQNIAEDALRKVREREDNLTVQELIRQALNVLMNRTAV